MDSMIVDRNNTVKEKPPGQLGTMEQTDLYIVTERTQTLVGGKGEEEEEVYES